MLVKYRPNRGFDSIVRQMRNFWDDFDNRSAVEKRSWDFVPKTVISEDKDKLYIHMEIPGFGKDDVNVSVNDERILTVSGEAKHETENEGRKFHRVERSHSSFSRSFRLSDKLDSEKVHAKFENGVLSIEIDKLESVKPRQIDIQ